MLKVFSRGSKTEGKWYISEDWEAKYENSLETKQHRVQRMVTLKSKELALRVGT